MPERFKIKQNINKSKNTRLPIAEDFANYRFNRDELAHVSRYLFVIEKLIELSKRLKKPLKVLDIGCGDIYIARVFQSSFIIKKNRIIKEYVGFDIDYKCLKKTENNKINSFNINLKCGDITKGDLKCFRDKYFDVVICLEVVEHIKPKFVNLLLREIKRLSDYAFISTPNFTGGSGRLPKDHIKEWDYEELNKIILRNNLKIIYEVGVFSNLNLVKEIAKKNSKLENIYNFLKDRVDSNFLSIIMAKFIGNNSQNILRFCKC